MTSCFKMSLVMVSLFFGLSFLPQTALSGEAEFEQAYQKVRKAYYQFRAQKDKQKFRHNWQKIAKKFEAVVKKYPKSPRAADALFTAGRLYNDLYRISRVDEDLKHSIRLFRQLVEKYPKSHLADDAQMYVALQWIEFRKKSSQAVKELSFLVDRFPKGDVVPKARRMLEDLGGPDAEDGDDVGASVPKGKPVPVNPNTKEPPPSPPESGSVEPDQPVLSLIEHESGPSYTRITMTTQLVAKYKFGVLPATQKSKFPRLYVDLQGTTLDSSLKGPITIKGSVVRKIRFGYHKPDVIRVVIDLAELGDYKIIPMDSPARVVVDVSAGKDKVASIIGKKTSHKTSKKKVKPHIPSKSTSRPGRSLSMLAGLKIRRVVIDPGHGGRDPGAIGKRKTLEKNITLDLAKRLADLLRKDKSLGLKEVILTRNSDRFVALERRTAIANKKNADLFISIHCNAHRQRRFRGVETFYLDLTNDRYSMKLAARENATSEKTISDLKYILADLALKSHVDDSISLGRSIQKATVGKLRRSYKKIKDLRLKPALFYVLIGARMPSVLVETSFISNPEEENRLRTKVYRQRIAEGIHAGLKNFIDARNKEIDPDS